MSNYKTTLQSNNTALNSNNLDLQSLIDQANALPDAGGVELPELTNEGSAADLLSGKQFIDQEGEVVTGTFSIDSEMSTQDSLISQIQTALQNKTAPSGGIIYFTVQNNLPDDLYVNGIYCPAGGNTAIPYNKENYRYTLFMIPYQSEEYLISAPYIQIYEGDDGEIIEESMDGAPAYSLNENFGIITGMLMDFHPDPDSILNNTITFEAEY